MTDNPKMVFSHKNRRLQLGQLLISQGSLDEERLAKALEFQAQNGNSLLLGEVLQKLDLCSEEDIMQALAAGYEVPYTKVSPRIADPRVIDILPRDFLDRHTVLPLFKIRDRITLAVNEPANVFLTEEIEQMTGAKVFLKLFVRVQKNWRKDANAIERFGY